MWKQQLKQRSQETYEKPGHFYIETRDGRYNMETVDQMLILLKARDIRRAVERELEWFAGSINIPKSIRKYPNSDSLSKFQDLVFHQKWDKELVGYGLSGDELAGICCKRCLSPGIIQWLLNLLNTSQNEVLCVYHAPNEDNKKYVQDCLDKRTQVPTSLFVVCSVGCSKDGVFMSCEKQLGCHFSFSHITRSQSTNEILYGDSLGWPAPNNLKDVLASYFQAVFKCPMTNFNMSMCHNPHQTSPDFEHICSTDKFVCVQNFPLQKCRSMSSVVTLLMAAFACLKRTFFDLLTTVSSTLALDLQHLKDPSGYAKYLRRVVASWIADKEICLDYLIPKNFERECMNEDELDSGLTAAKPTSGDLQEELVIHRKVEHDADKHDLSCQNGSNQEFVARFVNHSNSNHVQCNNSSNSEKDVEGYGPDESLVLNKNSNKYTDQSSPSQCSTPAEASSNVGNSCVSSENSMHSTEIPNVHNYDQNVQSCSSNNHKCLKCDYTTKLTFNMRRHLKRYHPGIRLPHTHTCPSCSYSSNKSADVFKHINSCHSGVNWKPQVGLRNQF